MHIQMYLYSSNFRVWKVCGRLSNIITVRYVIKKLVGRVESIHMQRKWRYGFSHYTTGRVGDFSVFEKASTEG